MSVYVSLKAAVKDHPVIQPFKGALIQIDDSISSVIGQAPDFIVAGTGRCGTNYIAHLLTALGVPTKHEYFFGPKGFNKRVGVRGDVSWLAVPYLQDYAGTVLHVVRHPVKVINALVSAKAFDVERLDNRYVAFMGRHFSLSGDQVQDAMKFYVEWNRRIEKQAVMRFQLEQVQDSIPAILEAIGAPLPRDYSEVLKQIPVKNSRSKSVVSMEDFPAGSVLDDLAEIANEYGYKLGEA